MSRKRSKVNTDVLDAQSAQLRTRPFGRGLLDAKPAPEDKKRCRICGGAEGSGAPYGERNGSYRHGLYTREAIAERKAMRRSEEHTSELQSL